MKMNMKNLIFICVAFLLIISACKRDEYFEDGGVAEAKFNGDMLQYLESKPVPFDTIAQIVKLAGLEETFRKDSLTFFAPTDEYIKYTIGTVNTFGINWQLRLLGKDTIETLSDISPDTWRRYLERYMFRGKNLLKDYPQVDLQQLRMFPGQLYFSYNRTLFNIGVVYNESNGVQYLGYRQLVLSYVPDPSNPDQNWYVNRISSSDIQPNNGIVHSLRYNGELFGFDTEFMTEVVESR